VFNNADTNRDNRLDRHEFQTLVGNIENTGAVSGRSTATSHYSSSTYSGGAGTERYGTPVSRSHVATGANDSAVGSSYDESTYGRRYGTSGTNESREIASYDNTSISSSNYIDESKYVHKCTPFREYAVDEKGLFIDPNPQIIRKPGPVSQVTYTQNIKLRCLQPPLLNPGPLTIVETREQPPAPPPYEIYQREPSPPQPPPIIWREMPPPKPPSALAKTVFHECPAFPVPPQSVVVHKLPALPQKPPDIIIERWLPYRVQKREIIVIPAEQYQPRNIIYEYGSSQIRINREIRFLGIQSEDPQNYMENWGSQLIDSRILEDKARLAGVVGNIKCDERCLEMPVVNEYSNISNESNYESVSSHTASNETSLDSAFRAADLNKDGVLTKSEFRKFFADDQQE